jgi:hypothetical protein
VKPFAKSPNPKTEAQSFSRGGFSRYGIRWTSRDAGLRAQWDTYAALPAQQKTDSLGNIYNPSGFNYYVAMNVHRRSVDIGPDDGPPTAAVPAIETATNIVVNATPTNTAVLTFAAPPGDGADAIWFAQLRMQPGRTTAPERNFLKVHFILQNDLTNPVTLSNLDDFFGPIQAGQELYVQSFRQHRQGRRNAATTISGIAA